MSIAPPRGPDNERGSADVEARPIPGEAASPVPPEDLAAREAGPRDEEIGIYESEARLDEVANPKRAARLLHEVARLYEQRPSGERDAARVYTQSLSSDPTLQANTWALFRLFSARASWENVLRLLDAETRFASLPTPADKADLFLEKGRILEDRMGRNEDALEAYRAALAVSPGHLGALLALLLLGVLENDAAAIDEALAGLAAHVEQPTLRALFVVERARRQRGAPGTDGFAGRVKQAVDTLFHALSGPAAEGPICDELDRVSLLAGEPDLRARVLDLLDARFGHEAQSGAGGRQDAALGVAVHREKARLLGARGGREAALAVLERGLRLFPRHPLLVADLLDLADEGARPDAIAALLHNGHLAPGEATDEAELRRAEAAARNGAYGEAMGILAGLAPESPLAPLAALLRVRVFARTGDADGLAEAFVAAAEARATAEADEAQKREAAHLFVRAAVVRDEALKDAAGATALIERALALVPGFAPARELERTRALRRGEVTKLAALYEEEAAREADPDRRARLYQSAYLVHRDLARDAEAAARLAAHAPPRDALHEAVAALDEAGERGAGRADEVDTVLPSLVQLLAHLPEGPASAGLSLLGARLLLRALHAGRNGKSEEELRRLGERAFAGDPTGGAAAVLEEEDRRAGRLAAAADVLAAELRAKAGEADREDAAAGDVRALRFRLALTAAAADRSAEALEALAPLRQAGDRAAVLWSLELARQANIPALEASLLREPAVMSILAGGGDSAASLAKLALVEAELARPEALGDDRLGAETVVADARAALAEVALPADAPAGLAAEVALAELRIAARERKPRGQALVAGFSKLADVLAGTAIGVDLRQDADLLSLAAAGVGQAGGAGLDEGSAYAGLRAFVTGVRTGAATQALAGLETLAEHARGPELFAEVGLRRLFSQEPAENAFSAFARAQSRAALPLVEVAVSDFGAAKGVLPENLRDVVVARAERLAASGTLGNEVATALLSESAARAEADGRLAASAAGYARMIDLDPSSMEAVGGLERVARARGDRRGQAAALLRLAALLRDSRAAAARVAAAARLYEDEGLREDAGAAYAQVLRLVPDNEDAYQRLHGLLVEREDPAALERLVTFKLAQAEGEAKIPLYAERAALRLGPLNRREEGVADHRRILAIEPGNVASLRALATAAMAAACPEMAARFLVQALAVVSKTATGETVSAEAATKNEDLAQRLRGDLANAYLACEDEDSAIDVLRESVAARPADRALRERLVEVAVRQRKWPLVSEQYRALSEAALTPEDKAAWIVRLGRVTRDEKLDVPAALAAFREAVRLDPVGEAARELSLTLGEVPLAPEDKPAITEAVEGLRQAIERQPLSPRRLDSLATLARLGGRIDLAETAAQLHSLLGGPASRGRSRGIVRTLTPSKLAPNLDDARVRRAVELWPILAAPVARLAGFESKSLGTGRSTRLAAGADPRLAWLDAASVGIGLGSLVVHVAGVDDLGVAAFDVPEPTLVLGRGIAGGDGEARFRAGRALALLSERAALCDHLTLDELERTWAAAVFLVTERLDPRFDAAAVRARAKALGKEMSRKERKAFAEVASDVGPSALDVPGWRTRVLRTANRVGLLVGGDLAMALRAVTKQANPSPADLETEECVDLIQFAFGDRYAALREEARQRDRISTGDHGGRG